MFLQQMIGILFGISIFAFFLFYLKQISSWTKSSFRWGLVIFEFHETFSVEISEQLINNTVKIWGVSFKFISQNLVIFRKTHGEHFTFIRFNRREISPLMGEILLDKTGTAKITLRLPFSLIALNISILITLIYGVIAGNGSNTELISALYQFSILFAIVVVFGIVSLLIEKDKAHFWVRKLKECIAEVQD